MNKEQTWDVTPKEAIELQKQLRSKIKLQPSFQKNFPRLIAGADVSLNLFSRTVYAGIIVLSFPDFKIVDYALYKGETKFPYIPGLLSFREVPALLECWKKLATKPDIVIVDGQGMAHPRRLGIATHFGLAAKVPTIGCAKSLLVGTYEEPAITAGGFSPIRDEDEVIGYALRSKKNVKPLIISPGHKTDLEESLEITKLCIAKHRLPEPTRQAHILVNQFRIGEVGETNEQKHNQ